jgi:hypothetical protein
LFVVDCFLVNVFKKDLDFVSDFGHVVLLLYLLIEIILGERADMPGMFWGVLAF